MVSSSRYNILSGPKNRLIFLPGKCHQYRLSKPDSCNLNSDSIVMTSENYVHYFQIKTQLGEMFASGISVFYLHRWSFALYTHSQGMNSQ